MLLCLALLVVVVLPPKRLIPAGPNMPFRVAAAAAMAAIAALGPNRSVLINVTNLIMLFLRESQTIVFLMNIIWPHLNS